MPIQDATEPRPPSLGAPEPSSSHKSPVVRILVYIVLIALAGTVAWRVYSNQKARQKQTAMQAAALMSRPVPVQVASAARQPMPVYLTALGTVTPNMSVTVKARVSGELLPVRFTEGQEVNQGQTIMVIDPKPYQAALDQAKGTLAHDQALLKNAQAEYARYKALFDAGVVSKETLDAEQASLGQYQGSIVADNAAVENAQLQLSWCYIQAPISGKIGLRLVDPGNIISANTTNLVIINQLRPIAIYFTLPENQLPQVLAKLRNDRHVDVQAYDRADVQKIADGQLLAADNQIDTTTGTAKLKAVFPNQDESLFPNEFVNIHLVMENRPNALVVPTAAIQTGVQGTFVWVVEKDDKGNLVAQIAPVKVAMAEGQMSILDSGPEPGASIVVDGADRLRPGGAVVVSGTHQSGGGQKNPKQGSLYNAPHAQDGNANQKEQK